VRLRALVFLLVLTVADYMLWNWSIANGRDILSLVAGLTLLPLGAVGVAQLALAGARLIGLMLGSSSARGRALAQARAESRSAPVAEHAARATASETDPPSSRLAA
jgi:hypothetical protein